jgi:enterochelin esterase-like enzyme
MKNTKISISIIAVVFAVIFTGCSKSADNSFSPVNKPEPTIAAENAQLKEPTPAASPTQLQAPTQAAKPTQAPVSVQSSENESKTEGALSSMVDISNAYMSVLTITEDCPTDATLKNADTAYGTVVHKTYDSKTTGLTRGVNVILPPNYDESKKYPVVYVLHGIFGNEHSMIDSNNKLIEISANLAADGKAKEMIIVSPDMYAKTDVNQQPGFTQEAISPYDNFINDLTNDLMPFIEETYSVLTGRENQAIVGFSMGGREALYIGFTRPDLFGYVMGIAPAPGLTPGKDWAMSHPGQMAEDELKIKNSDETPYLIMVCAGTNDGVVGKFPKSYHEIMERNGVNHIWYEVSGADHDARTIRSGIYNFFSSIFKAEDFNK